jgi:uncharacterized protein with HEPN domain
VSRGDDKRLNDIRRMCAVAADLVGRGRAAIEADPVLWLAMERAIEVAGEAATNLSDEIRSERPDVAWRELLATRVVLAHAYHRVDPDLLWDIAARDLPDVAVALGALDPSIDNGPAGPDSA